MLDFRRISPRVYVVALCAVAQPAAAVTLTNGNGEGDVTVEVDGFGRSVDALFDPVGPVARANVFFRSEVEAVQGSNSFGLGFIAESEATFISQDSTRTVSSFSISDLDFTLTQSVNDTIDAESEGQTGSILSQTYQIANTGSDTESLSLIRYLDGDLRFDGTLIDGGGILRQGGTRVLYETDATGAATDPDTFVGITASVGNAPEQGEQEFAVDPCCGVNVPLGNAVFNDTDSDGFIDTPYDVTLSLQGDYEIAAGGSATFTTNTLFGNATPPRPGATENLPLLPDSANGGAVPSFDFDISPIDFFDVTEEELFEDTFVSETFWIDPPVATGYTYSVDGAAFDSLTAPSLATVPDGDGMYTIQVNDTTYTIGAGSTFDFTGPVTEFVLTGIDPDLMLDPQNAEAFPLGIALTAFTQTSVIVTQTAIITDTTPTTPIPLPASLLLLGAGLASLTGLRRGRGAHDGPGRIGA